mgnify:CR=1 FL=1
MRMVTVNPKIWNVIVIGILSPPLRGETKPPIAVLEPQGFNRTAYILPGKSKNVNSCDRFRALDKPQEPAIIKITQGSATSGFASSWGKASRVNSRNRHWPEWRFLPLMRMVTVNPKIWNVIVIGILSPPLRGETKPPIAVLEPQGFNRTAYILPGKSKNVNSCDRFRALDKPQEPAIIKITKDASTSGCPRLSASQRKHI